MSVAVRGQLPRTYDERTASEITSRLQALERALGSLAPTFVAPSYPTFGAGNAGAGGVGGTTVVNQTTEVTQVLQADESIGLKFLLMGA